MLVWEVGLGGIANPGCPLLGPQAQTVRLKSIHASETSSTVEALIPQMLSKDPVPADPPYVAVQSLPVAPCHPSRRRTARSFPKVRSSSLRPVSSSEKRKLLNKSTCRSVSLHR